MFRYWGGVTEVSCALGALCSLGLSWAALSQSAEVFEMPMAHGPFTLHCTTPNHTRWHLTTNFLWDTNGARQDGSLSLALPLRSFQVV
jgi:hypothetical protein